MSHAQYRYFYQTPETLLLSVRCLLAHVPSDLRKGTLANPSQQISVDCSDLFEKSRPGLTLHKLAKFLPEFIDVPQGREDTFIFVSAAGIGNAYQLIAHRERIETEDEESAKQIEPEKSKEKISPAAPVEKAPVEKAPVEKAPVEKAPVEKAPVEKAPVEKAPVEKKDKFPEDKKEVVKKQKSWLSGLKSWLMEPPKKEPEKQSLPSSLPKPALQPVSESKLESKSESKLESKSELEPEKIEKKSKDLLEITGEGRRIALPPKPIPSPSSKKQEQAPAPPSPPKEKDALEIVPIKEKPVISPLPEPAPKSRALEEIPDQEAVQALFLTEDELTIDDVIEQCTHLPGIRCSILAHGSGVISSSRAPSHIDILQLTSQSMEMIRSMRENMEKMGIGSIPAVTLHSAQGLLTIFPKEDVCLLVMHADRNFIPGVREKLVSVVEALSQANLPLALEDVAREKNADGKKQESQESSH